MTGSLSLPFILFALASSKDAALDRTALARQIKMGDHTAFKTFFDTCYDPLFRFLVSKNTSPEVAKDLVQKAFIYIWEHRHKIDPEKSLRAYIYRIAYTRMLNHHRDNKKFNDETAVPKQESSFTPEDDARASDLKNAIDRAIDQMPEKRGTVFKLCFIEDFSYKEAAAALEITRKTVENHMGYALKDMRNALKNFR